MEDIRRFFYNYLHLFVGRVLLFGVVQLVTLLLLVRILTPDEYGNYVLFLAGASIVMLLMIWTSAGIVRFGREEFIAGGSVRKTLWANIWLLLPCFVVSVVAVGMLEEKIGEYILLPAFPVYLMMLYILVASASFLVPVFFQAMGRMGMYSYLPFVCNGAVLLAVSVVYITGYPITVGWLIAVLVIAHTCSAGFGLWLLRRELRPCFPSEWIKRLLAYVWPLIFAGISQNSVRYMDQIVIGVFLTTSYVGIYNVAYQLYDYAVMLPVLSISLTFPLMVSLVVNSDRGSVERYIRIHARQIAFLWALLVACVVVFVPELFTVFGPDYRGAIVPFMILFTSATLGVFQSIESPVITSHGYIKEAVVVNLITAVVNLGLNLILIPLMGINGAALATMVAHLARVVSYSYIVKWKVGLNDYRNYSWVFPALLGLAVVWCIEALFLRIVFLVALVAASVWIARKSGIFDDATRDGIERVDMPVIMKRVIRAGYSVVGGSNV